VGTWSYLDRDGVRLACHEFGGAGPAVLLLHGLAGHAQEWTDTAGSLVEDHRVLAIDARGHGRSERRPRDVSPDASVADVAFVIERLHLAPVVLIGQSLGGLTALLTAARHPELVHGLVVAEASPSGGDEGLDADVAAMTERLRRWPVPFASREEAVAFFGGPGLVAEAWADGLENRDGGLWPSFDIDVLVATLRAAFARSYWDEWRQIRCPTLVVRAGRGTLGRDDVGAMLDALVTARLVEIHDAAHDVHLDRPGPWRRAITDFARAHGERTADPVPSGEPVAALVLTGAPGAGKSAVLEALTTLLEVEGVAFGAIESEQLARGSPWLKADQWIPQLASVLALQRQAGRRLFLVAATTETAAELRGVIDALAAHKTLVVCLNASPDTVAARIAEREPDRWPGKHALIEHSRDLALSIPYIDGIDLRIDTDGRAATDVASEIRDALRARGALGTTG
jgi:pimeloyl-ACP methyl ester carboxylesterase/chloramphenicol 3-O-phosphotransferase